jgi:hypothetical protein
MRTVFGFQFGKAVADVRFDGAGRNPKHLCDRDPALPHRDERQDLALGFVSRRFLGGSAANHGSIGGVRNIHRCRPGSTLGVAL